jgi:hypothetical protein
MSESVCDEEGPWRRLAQRRERARERLAPRRRLDRRLAVLPEAPERREEGLVDVAAHHLVEDGEQRRRNRMADALEERLYERGRRRAARVQRWPELGAVAECLAAREVVAEEIGQDRVVEPPLLHADQAGADRRALVEREEIGEREVNRPGRELVDVRRDLVASVGAVGSLRQRREPGAGEGEVGALRVLQHGVERHRGIGEQRCRLLEVGMLGELVRMRRAAGEVREREVERVQLLAERQLARLRRKSGLRFRRRQRGRRRLQRRLRPGSEIKVAGGEPHQHADDECGDHAGPCDWRGARLLDCRGRPAQPPAALLRARSAPSRATGGGRCSCRARSAARRRARAR